MKIISIIIGIIFTINLVSAVTIIAGNQEIVTLDVNPDSCMIIDSQNDSLSNYSLDGLNFTIDGNKVIINTHPALKPDNYILICDYSWTEEVVIYSSGGGGSCSYNPNYDWNCNEWSECINNQQTRTCQKSNNCGTTYGKPNEIQTCSVTILPTNQTQPLKQEPTKPTKSWLVYILIGIAIVAVVILITTYIILKRKNEQKNKN